MKETRILNESKLCVRSDDGTDVIEGYASVFNHRSKLIAEGDKVFYEIMKPGAFNQALQRQDLNVIMNRDHNDYKMLARSSSGTLTLTVDDYGLKYTFVPPQTQLGIETLELVKRGDLFESSFRFSVIDSPENVTWYRDNDGLLIREISNIYKLYDTSVVINGAYSGTGLSVRGLTEFEEQEKLMRKQELDAYYVQIQKQFYGD